MRFFYCAFESIFDPVLDSQVLTLLKKLNYKLMGEDEKINLIVFNSIKDISKKKYWEKRKYINNFLERKAFFGLKFPYFKKMPQLLKFSLYLNTLNCLFIFFFIFKLKKSEKVLIHCRTEIGSYILLNMKNIYYSNIKIICDCRGVGSEEILYKNISKNRSLTNKIRGIEKYARFNSDQVFCVSNVFKDYILKESGRKNKEIRVIPSCIDTERFYYDLKMRKKIRDEMEVKNRFVILYSGSLNEWQLPDEMIRIFKVIKEIIQKSIFVMFTRDLNTAEELFSNSGLEKDSYIIKSIPHSRMNEHLLIGDLGLLIRENNIVNKVASPIKFSEYIRCGVPVLSSIPSDIIQLIDNYGLGFKLNNYNDDTEVKKIALNLKEKFDYFTSSEYKIKISNIISKEMGWDSYTDLIIDEYRTLLQ